MEKFTQLHDRLALCYNRIPYNQYFTLSEDAKEETCLKERQAVVEGLNSDSMNFENILKDRINVIKGN
jgi:hypothetical protein